ncbi:hypothetical protein P8935_11840 [Telmatobacter sp. DSM 110680]|uniref:DUF4139 domain-containing protein n=1 Tax=Telmatobacter sp. DSM 110680 TaxID=3036704 RepID=A0AAU7DSG0_9BACT
MRLWVTAPCLAICTLSLTSQQPAKSPRSAPKAQLVAPLVPPRAQKAGPQTPQVDLPVRKVVLYKNGVGYFEHAGTVSGNQRVAIDFTSPQLNDVLQSLTVLDEGGGRIGGVNYNSTTPLGEQLKTLSLGMSEDPTSTELFGALRGQKVEVTGGPSSGFGGGTVSGRLMSIEARTQKIGSDENASSIEKFFLTIVAGTGAVRVIELTPALSVRPTDSSLQGELDRYLQLLSTAHSTGLRHLTLDALGTGSRQLRVSYISEVPVWKATYRMVFPRDFNGNAIVQGWAVVDNTVGADWNNVQLSLVAGAPQSFIQPISQPLYTRRPEIPIATEAQTTPQTHEAAETVAVQSEVVNGAIGGPQRVPRNIKMAQNAPSASFGVAGAEGFHGSSSGVMGSVFGSGSGNGIGGMNNGVYRPSDAIAEGDVSTNAFDDFFQYSLTQPVTIHKNESAMVPILQQELPAEHVTLWSRNEPRPLRAVWLENKSKLTLDAGSFSIFESGEFAGEGLLDPIHPGERRLLSYAADQAMRVKITDNQGKRTLHHLQIRKGLVVERYMDVSSMTYSATNSGDEDRVVLLEHPRHTNGWTLDEGAKPAETTADLYRFRLTVKAHASEKLEVRERGPEFTQVSIDPNQNTNVYLLDLIKRVPDAEAQLKPILAAQAKLADLNQALADAKKQEETAAADEARDRENLTALKGNDAARRFVDELNHAEDLLQSTRKHTADLEQQKAVAVENLRAEINALNFDWDATIKN